jgi:16S rRNA (guanine527-N7)-methyltransferase
VVEHASAFGLDVAPPHRAADLGSGGGVPGLVLACSWATSRWSLIESQHRRAEFLRRAVIHLDLDGRVSVVERRAEDVGRDPEHRGAYDLVVARGFGPPAVVAECAAPLLRRGARLVVSEPPGGEPARWPVEGLRLLGLAVERRRTVPSAFQTLRQVAACPARYPRRPGIPAKRPLF